MRHIRLVPVDINGAGGYVAPAICDGDCYGHEVVRLMGQATNALLPAITEARAVAAKMGLEYRDDEGDQADMDAD